VIRHLPLRNAFLHEISNPQAYANFSSFFRIPTHWYEEPLDPGRASGRPQGLPNARPSPGPLALPPATRLHGTHSHRASCSYFENHMQPSRPARERPCAYMTRIRPARPTCRPQTRDWRHPTWVAQAPNHEAIRQNVQSRTLECRISRSTIYSTPRRSWQALLPGIDKPHISGHRQALRPPGP
jgi:hypothetical protein